MSAEFSWLRQQPRQQRSIERIEAILDTAERVFHDVGYDNANTNLIADRAGIPVATLYRWFPDKAALADGLAARYLERLSQTYTDLISSAPPKSDLMRTGIHDLARLVADNPGLPTIVAASVSSTTTSALRTVLHDAVAMIIRTRVPTVENDDLARISRMVTTLTFAALGDALGRDDADYEQDVDEFSNLIIAWLGARFPPPDDPVWDVANPLIVPLAPTHGDRGGNQRDHIGGRNF